VTAIAAIDHLKRGVALSICMLVMCSGVAVSVAAVVSASQDVFARSNPSAASLPSPPCDAKTPYGKVLVAGSVLAHNLPPNTGHDGATYDVYSNYQPNRKPQICAGDVLSGRDRANRWGVEFQCTELAIRVADGEWAIGDAEAWLNAGWNGLAVDMFAHHPAQLTAVANGSGSLPQPGDLMVWSSSDNNQRDPGHVAVIASVARDHVTFVGENQGSPVVSRPLNGTLVENNGWKSGTSTIIGWLHGRPHLSQRAHQRAVTRAPVVVGPQTPAYEVAFQAKSGDLSVSGATGSKVTSLSINNGTTPSVAALTGGGFEVAFQESGTGHVWTAGSAGVLDSGFTPLQGTSPGITGLTSGSYELAMQTAANDLITVGPNGMTDWNLEMAPGTSPSIVAVPGGGYEVAFQAKTNQLYVVGTSGIKNTELGMLPGTSPGIAAFPNGGYEVAFQANTSRLWITSATGASSPGLGMLAGTSPSIATFADGGYEVAFQSSTRELWTFGAAGAGSSGLGMLAGTSPTITALAGDSFSVALQANTHHLWRFDGHVGAAEDSGLMMSSGTSPGIAALPSGYGSWPVPAGPPEPL
jgi:CHAP domain